MDNAIKVCTDQLDSECTFQLLDQASESKGGEISCHYAISIFGEVARMHKHQVIPFIPRIMDTILRSLSSESSSQHLQQACSKVVASIARYTVDPTKSRQENQDVFYCICSPFLPALSSKVETLAFGAAMCLQALVESEKWKWAPTDLQNTLCAKVTAALEVQATQSVAYMSLMRSLAKFSSIFVQQYTGQLLQIGTDVLQSTHWQKRVAAAQLIGIVLKIGGPQLVHADLCTTLQALEDCQSDEVAGVRSAAAKALEANKHLGDDSSVIYACKSEGSDVSDSRSFKSSASSLQTLRSASLLAQHSPLFTTMEPATCESTETKCTFKLLRWKKNSHAMKSRRDLSDSPFLSLGRDDRKFPGALNLSSYIEVPVKTSFSEPDTGRGCKLSKDLFSDNERPVHSSWSDNSETIGILRHQASSMGIQEDMTSQREEEKIKTECLNDLNLKMEGRKSSSLEGIGCSIQAQHREEVYDDIVYIEGYEQHSSCINGDVLFGRCNDLVLPPKVDKRAPCSYTASPGFSKLTGSGVAVATKGASSLEGDPNHGDVGIGTCSGSSSCCTSEDGGSLRIHHLHWNRLPCSRQLSIRKKEFEYSLADPIQKRQLPAQAGSHGGAKKSRGSCCLLWALVALGTVLGGTVLLNHLSEVVDPHVLVPT